MSAAGPAKTEDRLRAFYVHRLAPGHLTASLAAGNLARAEPRTTRLAIVDGPGELVQRAPPTTDRKGCGPESSSATTSWPCRLVDRRSGGRESTATT